MAPQTHMQGNMQVPDELLALFSRNLTFNPELQAAMANEQAQQQQQQQQQEVAAAPAAAPAVYSASQHYTHSYHVNQRPSSAPLENDLALAENLLREHGVEPSLLTPSQLQLFKTAEDAQKLRLLELWSICPPNGAQNIPALAWSSTSLEQEEHLARVRYTRQQQQLQQEQEAAMQAEEPSMEQIASGHWTQPTDGSEPYMASGYEELMRRENERATLDNKAANAYCHFNAAATYNKAMDPIYLGPDFVREQQQIDMASQYGAFEQFRGADAMDVM